MIGHPGIGDADDNYEFDDVGDSDAETDAELTGDFNLAEMVERKYRGRFGTLVHKAIQYDLFDMKRLQRYDRSLAEDVVKAACLTARTFRENEIFAPYSSEKGESKSQYAMKSVT